MSQPFIAEVRIFAGNFAPRGWSFCNGALLPISQNTALFSLIGTFYGGDGRTTMGLPNLQGRAAMHPGRGPGLTPRQLGQVVGEESVTLTLQTMPNHSHVLGCSEEFATDDDPPNQYPAKGKGLAAYSPTQDGTQMAESALPNQGGNQAHENRQPFLAMYFIIALTGTYPTRS